MELAQLLEKEYRRRIANNPSYSLRAFARDLSVDQSSLSKILAGKRKPTNEVIQRVTSNLGLSAAQAKRFFAKIEITHPHYVDFEYERFVVVSDWYHDAILELIDTHDFEADLKWIADRLGIKETQVKAAVRRLRKLSLLEIDAAGNWFDKSKVNAIHPEEVSPEALKSYQKQTLARSAKAIDDIDLTMRSHTSNMFSASRENIEEAKRLIAKCRKDVAALMRSSNSQKTEVFQIQIGLFPVSKNKSKNKSRSKGS